MTEENNPQPAQAVTDVSGLLPPEHWAEVAQVRMIRNQRPQSRH
jgi:hypothetical protein